MQPQTIVVKIGTSSLTQSNGQIAIATIAALVETIVELRSGGHRLVLVSSGAVGIGRVRLGIAPQPNRMALKQAIAAVGQGRLIRIYDDLFSSQQQPIAQVLLTRRELTDRSSYVNARNTFEALFELGVVPIVNENDTVAIDELKFGDNDTLSALVASLIEADWLFLLTDVDRLYSADPRRVPDARPIDLVESGDFERLQIQAGDSSSSWGTGGMVTKLAAARIATSAGVRMAIARGKQPDNIIKILQGANLGTQFKPQPRTDNARKRWIAYGLIPSGSLYIDRGAVEAICRGGKSLLAAGIAQVQGDFLAGEAVKIYDLQNQEIARGIVNYSSGEIDKIKGRRSVEIKQILIDFDQETIIHRDNLVVFDQQSV